MIPDGFWGKRLTRRRMLRWAIISAAGAGVLLGTGSLLTDASPSQSGPDHGKAPSHASTTGPDAGVAGPLRVKVVYFSMSQSIDLDHEYFVLQSPAALRDLLNQVVARHAVLSAMIPAMQVLIDGLPARPDAKLADGDEVDFIPVSAGG